MRMALVFVVVACGGDRGTEGQPCASGTDCETELDCAGPNDGPVCGAAPNEQCIADADCVNGRCHAVFDGCSRDNVGSECRPACTGDPECGQNFRCDAGACVAVACNAGFACPGHQTCDPARITGTMPVHARHHGCFDVPCTDDATCGTRFCVNSICQDTRGTCRRPMLVP